MSPAIVIGILVPFIGTVLGSGCVFLMKREISEQMTRVLAGFAAGVMIAASIWSLLQPAMDESAALGRFAFVPAVAGFWAGILFLLVLDHVIPHEHNEEAEGPQTSFGHNTLMTLAVTLHNIPEGMAVGVVFAGWITGTSSLSLAAAMALSLGIAIQNFPEGAIISMPLHSRGVGKGRSFAAGALSGIVEPIGAAITVLAANVIAPLLPYLLSFAAGAMVYVVIDELVPEMNCGRHSDLGIIAFATGFTIMMALDVALG